MPRAAAHAFKVLFLLFLVLSPQGRSTILVFVERPAFVLVAVLAVWALARSLGAGSTMGYDSAREMDILVTGGLAGIIGLYALLCRGVGMSGLVATAILTAAFLGAVARRHGRPGMASGGLTALIWCAVLYRYAMPL